MKSLQAMQRISQNSAQKKLQSYKRKKKIVINAFISVTLLFLVLCGSVRYLLTVANAIAQIPGMKPFVDMIALDKGIEDILQNNYFERSMRAKQLTVIR